ncbi:hypothetical protein INQ40_09785 [Lysobacter sp. H21R4]|uniref:hypothetical protein n=1 Tax=Lysobacter sp. H21R4 TaxID=2781021 RepID=UPI001887BECE|nr:hypothetical protein [Lysobacter sp. H21R4]QOY62208.1 hypothetical protein INQ40_09785 [Lysobacter sp. H21R4]
MPPNPPHVPRPLALIALTVALALGCTAQPDTAADADAPEARLSGVLLDMQMDEISGLAASHIHPGVLWMHDDGGNPARLFAVSTRGRRLATFGVEDAVKTDWEDMDAFEFQGKRYLLIADTGDNGGLRRTLQLHVVEEPTTLTNARLKPAWSIAFRWPDGARDCEAVAVDAERGEILLISKKREPPELFVLPLQPPDRELLTATRVGHLAGVPEPDPETLRRNPKRARLDGQVTAASVSPDRRTLAVMTYRYLLLYPRGAQQDWAGAVAGTPRTSVLPWLPQAEALGWSADGESLYATGEFIPAPLYRITP